ncbi:MAG: hypothetical protein ACXWXT_09900, partial [Candidatus Binatia bacterium]
MTALKAGAEVGESQKDQFHNNVAAVLPTVELIANRPNESLDATVRESTEGDLTSLPAMVDESAATSQSIETDATNPSITVVSTVFASPVNAREFRAIEATAPDSQAVTDFPTAEAEFETAVAAVVKTPSLAEAVLLEDFAAPAEQFAESLAMAALSQSVEVKHLPQIEAPKQQKSHPKANEPLGASRALVPANENFDLRLLDDLVSNYGEFAANPYLPATIEKKEIQSFELAASVAEELRAEWPSPAEATAPLVRKNGELDRQLKKIIKDYGENDLYAHKQTTNIKKAGILAFVFLGLVFGVIYFFKAPSSTAKTAPAAANSTPSATQDDRKSQSGAKRANGDSRERSLNSTPNVEKPTAKINN